MGEFASKGVAGAALGTGIGGLALGVLNGAGGLLNLMGGANCGGCGNGYAGSAMVNRYELGLVQELAAKDAKIGLLEADKYTDQKIVEAYKDLQGQINAVAAEVRANKDEQYQVNMQQAVYNGTNTSTLQCMQQQIAQLQSLTKLVVPNGSVCPGWGNVTITPAAATTTTSPAA